MDISVGDEIEITLDLDEVIELRKQAARALEIERALPFDARTAQASVEDEAAYTRSFIEIRATNDALEAKGIIPATTPEISSNAGVLDDKPFTCRARVCRRPDLALSSLEPVDLRKNRIPKPGFSLEAARRGDEDVEYVEDLKTLRIVMGERLHVNMTQELEEAIVEEYRRAFEHKLEIGGLSAEIYRTNSGLDEDQYASMLSNKAISEARWGFALDATADAIGIFATDEDLHEAYGEIVPGHADELIELHELRNDIYRTIQRIRRRKAQEWLLETAIV